jgi:hypothetical protein
VSTITTEQDMTDTIAGGILVLTAALVAVYFHADLVTAWSHLSDTLANGWSAYLQVADAVVFGDFHGGYLEEDSALIDAVFTAREFVGL